MIDLLNKEIEETAILDGGPIENTLKIQTTDL